VRSRDARAARRPLGSAAATRNRALPRRSSSAVARPVGMLRREGKARRSGGSVRRALPECSPRPSWPGTHRGSHRPVAGTLPAAAPLVNRPRVPSFRTVATSFVEGKSRLARVSSAPYHREAT
jgi:hypothetical protein